MKKVISCLCCLLILAGGLVFPVTARESSLSFEETVANAIANFDSSVDVSEYGLSTDDAFEKVFEVIAAHPEFFYLNSAVSVTPRDQKAFRVNLSYIMTQQEANEAQEGIDGYLNPYIFDPIAAAEKNGHPFSDLQKVLFVHDTIVRDFFYDARILQENGSSVTVSRDIATFINGKLKSGVSAEEATADDYIIPAHTGVCEAYAKLFLYCMNRLGIPADLVSSSQGNHAWNTVLVEGNWYHIDCTYDDPIQTGLGYVGHGFFLLSTGEMYAADNGGQGAHRSDWVSLTGQNHDCVTSFSAPLIRATITPFVPDLSGNWYFIGVSEKLPEVGYSETAYLERTGDLQTAEKLSSFPAYWRIVGNPGQIFPGPYSGLFSHNGRMIYNSDDQVLVYSPKTGKTYTVYKSDPTQFYIYGMLGDSESGESLLYLAKRADDGEPSLAMITLCANSHEALSDWVTVKEATETQRGTRIKTCDICGRVAVEQTLPKIGEAPIGDLNGDGSVDTADLSILKKHLAGLQADPAGNTDCNSDGRTDTADLALLKKYLANLVPAL